MIYGLILIFALFPVSALAQIADSPDAGQLQTAIINIVALINDILIPFIIAIGFLAFVWGIFLYFIVGGADEEKKVKGRSLMINATFGFVMIIIFFGVINLITSSTGLEGETIENVPTVPLL